MHLASIARDSIIETFVEIQERALSDEIPTMPLAVVAPCDEQPVPIF